MATKAQTRTSSPRIPSRRPRLMRASATAPSLATSNASRNDLASLQSLRATTILTRVASYSSAQRENASRTSPTSSCSSPEQRSPESTRKEPFEVVAHQPGSYFSFPSFEDFQEYQEDDERLDGRSDQGHRKEKGVP